MLTSTTSTAKDKLTDCAKKSRPSPPVNMAKLSKSRGSVTGSSRIWAVLGRRNRLVKKNFRFVLGRWLLVTLLETLTEAWQKVEFVVIKVHKLLSSQKRLSLQKVYNHSSRTYSCDPVCVFSNILQTSSEFAYFPRFTDIIRRPRTPWLLFSSPTVVPPQNLPDVFSWQHPLQKFPQRWWKKNSM